MTRPETRLVLIRHGESVAQVERYLSGHATCRGLTTRGREQAAQLRRRLLETRELAATDTVFTSGLPRAIETERLLRPALGSVPARADCEWCEIRAGSAEGLGWDEFQARYPPADDPADPTDRRIPDGESWVDFFARAGARLARIASEHPGERVVVVCHGGIIGASFVALGGASAPAGVARTHETANTSLTEWRTSAIGWQLVRWNDAEHLERPERSG